MGTYTGSTPVPGFLQPKPPALPPLLHTFLMGLRVTRPDGSVLSDAEKRAMIDTCAASGRNGADRPERCLCREVPVYMPDCPGCGGDGIPDKPDTDDAIKFWEVAMADGKAYADPNDTGGMPRWCGPMTHKRDPLCPECAGELGAHLRGCSAGAWERQIGGRHG